jgi:atypical dual specificity phosphatase
LLVDDPTTTLATALTRLGLVLSVEEKVDGANLGFSLDSDLGRIVAQNRSHYVCSADHPQFRLLDKFIAQHSQEMCDLFAALSHRQNRKHPQASPPPHHTHMKPAVVARSRTTTTVRPILFGEWLVAKHSIHYTALPDYFVAFDILLPTGEWAGRALFRELMAQYCPTIRLVPDLTPEIFPTPLDVSGGAAAVAPKVLGKQVLEALKRFVESGTSKFRRESDAARHVEGVYVRLDDPVAGVLVDRCKIVRRGFICGSEHWSSHTIEKNVLKFDASSS